MRLVAIHKIDGFEMSRYPNVKEWTDIHQFTSIGITDLGESYNGKFLVDARFSGEVFELEFSKEEDAERFVNNFLKTLSADEKEGEKK